MIDPTLSTLSPCRLVHTKLDTYTNVCVFIYFYFLFIELGSLKCCIWCCMIWPVKVPILISRMKKYIWKKKKNIHCQNVRDFNVIHNCATQPIQNDHILNGLKYSIKFNFMIKYIWKKVSKYLSPCQLKCEMNSFIYGRWFLTIILHL